MINVLELAEKRWKAYQATQAADFDRRHSEPTAQNLQWLMRYIAKHNLCKPTVDWDRWLIVTTSGGMIYSGETPKWGSELIVEEQIPNQDDLSIRLAFIYGFGEKDIELQVSIARRNMHNANTTTKNTVTISKNTPSLDISFPIFPRSLEPELAAITALRQPYPFPLNQVVQRSYALAYNVIARRGEPIPVPEFPVVQNSISNLYV